MLPLRVTVNVALPELSLTKASSMENEGKAATDVVTSCSTWIVALPVL